MHSALVVGGNSGIGLSVSLALLKRGYGHIGIVGRSGIHIDDIEEQDQPLFLRKTTFYRLNLITEQYALFDEIRDIDTLVITAGFGRVAAFDALTEPEITSIIKCNELAVIRIIKKYYDRINSDEDFFCAVMGSIAGHVSSPLFSVYGASKAGVSSFAESLNAELRAQGRANRILEIAPGRLEGTRFEGGKNDIRKHLGLADEIVERMLGRKTLFIPRYEEVYKSVLDSYRQDPAGFGAESYRHKAAGGRVSDRPQPVVGDLSGTVALFHIGHLNLLRSAKEQCDYLVVGVHESGVWKGKETFIPFEERCELVRAIEYVDEVIASCPEDSDVYERIRYNKLFVGSDYKGSERFNRYEAFFQDKGVEIVYFPYTPTTSSTQLRKALQEG
jgi:cytidyltransferase-like protein